MCVHATRAYTANYWGERRFNWCVLVDGVVGCASQAPAHPFSALSRLHEVGKYWKFNCVVS